MTLAAVQGVPVVEAWLDDAPLPPAARAALARVDVRQRLSAPTQCELVFVAGHEAALPSFAPGLGLRVAIGGGRDLFAGDVTAVEYRQGGGGGLEIRVRAYDALHRLRRRQPLRAHVDAGLVELAQEIGAEHGLAVVTSAAPPVLPRLVQFDRSDLELLVDLGDRSGLHLFVDGSTLHLTSLAGRDLEIPLRLGRELIDVRVTVNAETACRAVEATGWDPSTARVFTATASEPRRGWDGSAAVDVADLGASGARVLADEPAVHADQIAARAQGELDRRASAEVTAAGTALGDPRLVPGRRVRLEGLGVDVPSMYTVTAVDHSFDTSRGFLSAFSTEPPATRPRSQAPVASHGLVSRVDDPEGLGRVRVQLPTFGDLETEWCAVVTTAAGAGKGLVALPDVGDQVLVLFPHGEPARGVVIGGLFGTTPPPDAGVEGGAVVRHAWTTRGGQRVLLDDAGARVRVEAAGGSAVELGPDRMTLHAATDLVIEAPGRAITVRARQIDFETA